MRGRGKEERREHKGEENRGEKGGSDELERREEKKRIGDSKEGRIKSVDGRNTMKG